MGNFFKIIISAVRIVGGLFGAEEPEPPIIEPVVLVVEVIEEKQVLPSIGTFLPIEKTWQDCSCVIYARKLRLEIPYGTDAEDLIPNSNPVIGGGILLGMSHVGVILDFVDDGYLMADGWEAPENPRECITREIVIPFNSDKIRGFVNY